METDVINKREFARFELNMRFGRITYVAQSPVSIDIARNHTDAEL